MCVCVCVFGVCEFAILIDNSHKSDGWKREGTGKQRQGRREWTQQINSGGNV